MYILNDLKERSRKMNKNQIEAIKAIDWVARLIQNGEEDRAVRVWWGKGPHSKQKIKKLSEGKVFKKLFDDMDSLVWKLHVVEKDSRLMILRKNGEELSIVNEMQAIEAWNLTNGSISFREFKKEVC